MTDPKNPETCLLIAEITGDAPLLGKLGAVETQRAVERCRNRAERAIVAFAGFTVEAHGRTLLAHFARSESAAQAAFDLRERVRQLPPVSGVTLTIRAALHVASLDAGGQPDAAALGICRELVAAAPAGHIVLSRLAADALPEALRGHVEAAGLSGLRHEAFAFHGNALPHHAATPEAASAPADSPQQPESADDAPAAGSQRNAMMLRHNWNMLMVSDNRPIVLAGREEGNDLVIADRRASRHHARIEKRHGRYILIDTSTNGTFMLDEAGNETALHRTEAEMPVRGRVGFGYSPTEAGAEVVYFDAGMRS